MGSEMCIRDSPSSSTGVSGLALSLAYQILRQLEGDMSVVSNADGGTCVSVHLPAWGALAAAHPESVVDP